MADEIHRRWMKSLRDEVRLRRGEFTSRIGAYRVRSTYRSPSANIESEGHIDARSATSNFVGLRGASFYLFTFHSYLLLNLCLLLIHRKRSPFSRRRRLKIAEGTSFASVTSYIICPNGQTSLPQATSLCALAQNITAAPPHRFALRISHFAFAAPPHYFTSIASAS